MVRVLGKAVGEIGVLVAGVLVATGPALAQVGVPVNGFPNWAERTDLVLSNRARADPATELAPCLASGACPDATCYSPAPPLVYESSLNLSARFHMANLVASASMLQHPSPCELASNIATTWPSSCDGDPTCACQGGASLCNCNDCGSCNPDDTSPECVTQPFERMALWTPDACDTQCGEDVAAGYSDPQAATEGWLQEQCASWNGSCAAPDQNTCSSTTENGHRWNILNAGYTQLGAGSVVASQTSSACYPQEWDDQDLAGESVTIPKLSAGTHFPQAPQAGASVQFWANWYDTAPPASAQVDVGGVCNAMTIDRGVDQGNATYTWQGTSLSGCNSYVFTFTDSEGTVWNVPSTGAYQVGDSCPDYVTTSPPACGGGSSSGGSSSNGGSSSSGGTSEIGSSGGSSSSGTSSAPGGSSGGERSSVTAGGGSGGSSGSGTSASEGGSSGELTGPAPTPKAESSGCGCGTRSGSGAGAWLWLGLLVLLFRRYSLARVSR